MWVHPIAQNVNLLIILDGFDPLIMTPWLFMYFFAVHWNYRRVDWVTLLMSEKMSARFHRQFCVVLCENLNDKLQIWARKGKVVEFVFICWECHRQTDPKISTVRTWRTPARSESNAFGFQPICSAIGQHSKAQDCFSVYVDLRSALLIQSTLTQAQKDNMDVVRLSR